VKKLPYIKILNNVVTSLPRPILRISTVGLQGGLFQSVTNFPHVTVISMVN
jgi:hypothetical protein